MTKPNGHANGAGSGSGNGSGSGDDSGKVHSLDDARRRAAEKAKAERRASGRPGPRPRTARDLVIGGLMLAMAIAGLASFFIDMTDEVPVPGAASGGLR